MSYFIALFALPCLLVCWFWIQQRYQSTKNAQEHNQVIGCGACSKKDSCQESQSDNY